MNNMELLSTALNYLEDNLDRKITTEDVARACYCSKSTLERLFRCVNNISVHDYVIRRRMLKATKLLITEKDRGILDIALECGYNSNEAFTRAFKQIWNCKPSEFRSQPRYSELFPRLWTGLINGDESMKKVDISELYDFFKTRINCYFICCDIKSLIPINHISRTAGDLAIAEAINRMQQAAGKEDVVFRIGGDEFILLTDSTDIAYAEELACKIKAQNNQTFPYENQEIPLSLYVCISRLENNHEAKQHEIFSYFHHAITEVKKF